MHRVIERLTDDHRQVLRRMEEVQSHLHEAAPAVSFLEFLEVEVAEHFRLEEEVLFPELATVESIAAGPLRVMLAEHDAFRELVHRARQAVDAPDAAVLRATLEDVLALLAGHIHKEDNILFPMARRLVDVAPRLPPAV